MAKQPKPQLGHRRVTKLDPQNIQHGHTGAPAPSASVVQDRDTALSMIDLLESLADEIDSTLALSTPNPYLAMAAHLVRCHLEGKIVTPSSLVAASGVPYATAMRKLSDMIDAGMIEQRPRTRSGKTVSLHASTQLLTNWGQLSDRVARLARKHLADSDGGERDYYFGGTYLAGHSIAPPSVLPEPITVPGGLRVLVHGDPTFMVMENLKRQFEHIVGTSISQRAFSIDRLHEETLRNATRKTSHYDIIAVDLPWIGEFAKKGLLMPLDEVMDISRLDPSDFHTAGWRGAHWEGRPYGVPSQTTPELLFYRKDLFAEAGLKPPSTTDLVLKAARHFHDPTHGRYGIAWNAARGTALGHTFIMAMADFGQPVVNLDPIAGGFDADHLDRDDFVAQFDTPATEAAAEYLLQLMSVSPPDILSMSWYERVRPYAAGKVAMAYGYTLLAPYFELDANSPAHDTTGYLPHPTGLAAKPVAPVGGYVLAIPANLPEERRAAAAEALIAFTSPAAQKLYVLNGSRTVPRYSVGADPQVQHLSPIFEAVDAMSWRDELQFWPRPPLPNICELIEICGQEIHDMLRGVTTPREALGKVQIRADRVLRTGSS
ncbi:sugar ABC transporter substrate-binding protein [Thioclava nitratireducens]|uniref:Sugar ABC transporter substrate-binding protein n=1 Tax=Thioclava nitratireducens TaxID=1915078 RepID=A0ABN4XCZ4_9RHOB|nr:extracellular solute-binding protein [Thioclava nitratireducens]AQS48131.1 sugar ABC transporter substrate-binding protein [Thioclava nitratireducens]